MSNNEGDVSKNAFVTVISTRLKLQTVQVSFPWNLILGTKPKRRMDCVNCVYVLHKTSGLGILRSSRAATVKKCTKKIAVRKKLLFYVFFLLFRRSSCCRLRCYVRLYFVRSIQFNQLYLNTVNGSANWFSDMPCNNQSFEGNWTFY